jgi:hypothetical protein
MSCTAQNHWSPDNDTWCHSYPSPPPVRQTLKASSTKVLSKSDPPATIRKAPTSGSYSLLLPPSERTPKNQENVAKVVGRVIFSMKMEGKCHLKVKYTSSKFPDEFLPQDHELIQKWMDTFVDMGPKTKQ